jgi:hypothetical protein
MRRISLLVLASLLGCQDYVFKQVCPNSVEEAELFRPALKATPTDVLFVVDNSGSMLDDQMRLAASFDRFIEAIAGSGDYQLAVVTTDLDKPNGEQEGSVVTLFSDTFPFVTPVNGGTDARDCRPTTPRIEHGWPTSGGTSSSVRAAAERRRG